MHGWLAAVLNLLGMGGGGAAVSVAVHCANPGTAPLYDCTAGTATCCEDC